jgi:2-amino-4-hydroxy-6-hydroxymethyldihydropteridine diphosphokinase
LDWREWQAFDQQIRADFSYPVEADHRAARRLRDLVPADHRLRDLVPLMRGRTDVTIVGCGPSLEGARVDGLVVAADGATEWLREQGVAPAVVVSDLDGDPQSLEWAAKRGAYVLAHAHGDNLQAIHDVAPRLGPRLYGTYQGPPVPGLAPLGNVGGFTDGDRAVVLAEHLGARRARLVGFDFDAPPTRYSHRWDPATKMRKLAWAQRVVQDVRRRGRLAL